jgi:hypothetical protein
VSADGTYRLKDEDEFAEQQRLGLLHPAEVAKVDAELALVLERVHAKASPFDDAAFAFRPQPAWANPAPFVEGWDEP